MVAKPYVLLVTDSCDERDMYTQDFQRAGFSTLQASTARNAFTVASRLKPAVIVTDIKLNGGDDGLTLTRRLRESAGLCQIPIVILTGYVFAHDREAASRAGCDVFVAKPCLPETLSAVVGQLIHHRHEVAGI